MILQKPVECLHCNNKVIPEMHLALISAQGPGTGIPRWTPEGHPRADKGTFEDDGGRDRSADPSRGAPREGAPSSSPSSLSTDGQETLNEWTSGLPGHFEALRDPANPSSERLVEMMDELPKHEGTVYRGMVLSAADAQTLAAQSEVALKFHSSSSTSFGAMKSFARPGFAKTPVQVYIKADITSGSHIAPHAGAMGEEGEVILRAGTKYQQTVLQQDKNLLYLDWKEK